MSEDEKKANITEKSVEDGNQVYGSRTVIDKYDRFSFYILVSQIVFAGITLMYTTLTASNGT